MCSLQWHSEWVSNLEVNIQWSVTFLLAVVPTSSTSHSSSSVITSMTIFTSIVSSSSSFQTLPICSCIILYLFKIFSSSLVHYNIPAAKLQHAAKFFSEGCNFSTICAVLSFVNICCIYGLGESSSKVVHFVEGWNFLLISGWISGILFSDKKFYFYIRIKSLGWDRCPGPNQQNVSR